MMKVTKRKLIATTLSGALLALASSMVPNTATHAADGGELVLGMGYSPPSLNPAVQSGFGAGVPGTQIFASPLRYDEDWNPQPYLAKSWNFSDDGLTLTLDLVDNAKFHDGEPVKASDVVFSINAVKANHPFKTMLAAVDNVEAEGDHKVIITLKHKHPALLLAMSPILLPVMPEHIYGDGQELKTHPRNLTDVVGSGPFVFKEFVADQHIILEKNPDFFMEGRPKLDRLVFKIVRDRSNMLLSMQRGDIHYNSYTSLTLRDIKRIQGSEDLVATDKGYAGVGPLSWVAFNTKREPWTDKRVRQAIAYAIDKNFIVNTMQLGLSRRATGPIADGSPFYTPDVPNYDYDPDKAMALLDEAGLKPDGDGVRMNITIDWIPGSTEFGKNVGEAIKAQLKKIGVNATVRSLPDFGSWIGQIAGTNDYDLSMESVFNWGDPVIGVHRTYVTSNIRKGVPFSNTSLYSNPRVDELANMAALETDQEKRKALYAEFQKIITEDVPLHFLHVVPYYTVHSKKLGGLPEGIWGSMAPFDRAHWLE